MQIRKALDLRVCLLYGKIFSSYILIDEMQLLNGVQTTLELKLG